MSPRYQEIVVIVDTIETQVLVQVQGQGGLVGLRMRERRVHPVGWLRFGVTNCGSRQGRNLLSMKIRPTQSR